jgi:hypothetical protein
MMSSLSSIPIDSRTTSGPAPAWTFCGSWRSSYASADYRQAPAAFNPVAIAAEPGLPASAEKAGVIEIEFAAGGRMRIAGPVDAATVSALLKALAKSKRRR